MAQVTLTFGGASTVRSNPCANIRKARVSDRAKRYRAHQPNCEPGGPKVCALCHSKRFLTIDHKDGDESNGERSNLRWLCKSCNTRLGARDTRNGRGRRTVQFNASPPYSAYMEAVATLAGEGLGTMTDDQARATIRATSQRKRSEYANDVWGTRYRLYGPSGRKDGGRGGKSKREEVPF